MRKIVSLLLALTLIVAMGAFSISASAASYSTSVGSNTCISTGGSVSNGTVSGSSTSVATMYVGYRIMPNLIYNEAGQGRATVTVNAFNYGAKSVTVRIGDKNYAATATSRYYRSGYYYTNLQIRTYIYDMGKPTGVISSASVTEFNITVRSRTYRFSGATFTASFQTELAAGTIRPVRSGAYLPNTKKTVPFTQCSAFSGGVNYSNGTCVSISGAGKVDGYMSVGQMDMYKLYSVRNYSQSGGTSSSSGRYTYHYTGDCVLA